MLKYGETYFKVSIIPHTLEETNLKEKTSGDVVNLECDIIRKIYGKICNSNEKRKQSNRGIFKGKWILLIIFSKKGRKI